MASFARGCRSGLGFPSRSAGNSLATSNRYRPRRRPQLPSSKGLLGFRPVFRFLLRACDFSLLTVIQLQWYDKGLAPSRDALIPIANTATASDGASAERATLQRGEGKTWQATELSKSLMRTSTRMY